MSIFKFFDESVSQKPTPNVDHKGDVILQLHKNENQRFEINYHNRFFAMGQLMTDIRTTTHWILKKTAPFEDGFWVDLEAEDQQVSNTNPAMNDVIEFAKVFNYPTRMLVLKLSPSGYIERVLNQEEILERWVEIKSDALKSLEETDSDRQILKNGDIQFSNTLPSLKQTQLYNIFFGPFYGAKKEGDGHIVYNGQYGSQLFQNTLINYQVNEKVISVKPDTSTIAHSTVLSNVPETLEIIKKMYDEMYKQLCGPDFNYQYKLDSQYDIDTVTGLINKSTSTFLEKANDGLYYQTDYSIKRI